MHFLYFFLGLIPDFLGGSGRGQTASAGVSASSSAASPAGAAAASASGASPSEKEKAESLELGELEQLTITNDNESSYDVSQCFLCLFIQGCVFLQYLRFWNAHILKKRKRGFFLTFRERESERRV